MTSKEIAERIIDDVLCELEAGDLARQNGRKGKEEIEALIELARAARQQSATHSNKPCPCKVCVKLARVEQLIPEL